MSIGSMNRRVIFRNETYSLDAGGGSSDVTTEQWEAWAEINDRSGNTYAAQATDLTQYDYRVKIRFDARVTTNTKMIYEGQICTIPSVSIEKEGYKDFMILRVTRTQTWVDLS